MALIALLIGLLLGAMANYWSRSSGRGKWLSLSYGALVASLPGIFFGIFMGNRIDEMGAIPYLVLAGLLFQFVLLPSAVAVVVIEIQTFRSGSSNAKK